MSGCEALPLCRVHFLRALLFSRYDSSDLYFPSDSLGVLALQEPFAAALHAVCNVDDIPVSARVCVVGPKKLGLLIVLALHVRGHQNIFTVGRNVAALEICSLLGAKNVSNGDDSSFDVVFDCSGNEAGFILACKLARSTGIVHVKSTGGLPIGCVARMNQLVVDEVSLLFGQSRLHWHCEGAPAQDTRTLQVESVRGVDVLHASGKVEPRGAIRVLNDATPTDRVWNVVWSKKLTIRTSRCGDIAEALAALDACSDNVKSLLSERFVTHVTSDFETAIRLAQSRDALKVLLQHNE